MICVYFLCRNVYLPIGLSKFTAKREDNLKTVLITVNFPPTMDIPETWSRGCYLVQRLPRRLQLHLRRQGIPVYLVTAGLEAHRPTKSKKKKDKVKETEESTEVDGNQATSMVVKGNIVPEGDMMLRRRTLAGHCHLHMTALIRETGCHSLTRSEVAIGLQLAPYDLVLTFKEWGASKTVKDRKTKGERTVPEMAFQLAYPLKECSRGDNKEACYYFGCRNPENMYSMHVFHERGYYMAKTVRCLGMPVKVVIYGMSHIDVDQKAALNRMEAVRYVTSGIPELDEEVEKVQNSGPNKREELVRAVVQESMEMAPENGLMYASPTKALSVLRTDKHHRHVWQFSMQTIIGDARAQLSHAAEEIIREREAQCEDQDIHYEEAVSAFRGFLEERLGDNVLESQVRASALLKHLANIIMASKWKPREHKKPQIFIKGVPDCGKSTLTQLIKKLAPSRVFTPGTEVHHSFSLQVFGKRAPGAIWIDDEVTPSKISRYDAADFNKLTEGNYDGYAASKGGTQKKIKWTGYCIFMGNYSLEEMFPGQSVRIEEFKARFTTYTFHKPEKIIRGKQIQGAEHIRTYLRELCQ